MTEDIYPHITNINYMKSTENKTKVIRLVNESRSGLLVTLQQNDCFRVINADVEELVHSKL